LQSFVEESVALLHNSINLLIVDLFPPTPRDPGGIHKAIWDAFEDVPFELPPDEPLTLAAYTAGDLAAGISTEAYVETIGIGVSLPDMPAFWDRRAHVPVPLEFDLPDNLGELSPCPAHARGNGGAAGVNTTCNCPGDR